MYNSLSECESAFRKFQNALSTQVLNLHPKKLYIDSQTLHENLETLFISPFDKSQSAAKCVITNTDNLTFLRGFKLEFQACLDSFSTQYQTSSEELTPSCETKLWILHITHSLSLVQVFALRITTHIKKYRRETVLSVDLQTDIYYLCAHVKLLSSTQK